MDGTEHDGTAARTIRPGVTLALVARRRAADDAPPPRAHAARQSTRVLTTVLFTDVVDSTGHAIALGDERWLALLERHEAMVRAEIRRAGGRPVAVAGDGMVATFDGAAAAVRCATRIARLSRSSFGLEVRCGLHCGEYERRGSRVGGIVFHVAARVVHLAAPGEVLVSETLKQLTAGSTLHFRARGRRTLRGLQGLWPIFGVTDGGDAAR